MGYSLRRPLENRDRKGGIKKPLPEKGVVFICLFEKI